MFHTDDIYLVAALDACGHRLSGVSRDNGRADFIFGDEVKDEVRSFYDGSLTLPAAAYAASVRSAKKTALSAPTASLPVAV